MQLNRNLELIHTQTGSLMWETQTLDDEIFEAVMQQNGDFVLLNQNRTKSLWASHTANSIYHIGSSLHLNNDGNLVMMDPDKNAIWETSTRTVCSGLVLLSVGLVTLYVKNVTLVRSSKNATMSILIDTGHRYLHSRGKQIKA